MATELMEEPVFKSGDILVCENDLLPYPNLGLLLMLVRIL